MTSLVDLSEAEPTVVIFLIAISHIVIEFFMKGQTLQTIFDVTFKRENNFL